MNVIIASTYGIVTPTTVSILHICTPTTLLQLVLGLLLLLCSLSFLLASPQASFLLTLSVY